jgi:hypothetical protein
MWIHGRRAVRPDGNFYRRQRRLRVERGTRLTAGSGAPRRAGAALPWIVAGVVTGAALVLVSARALWS